MILQRGQLCGIARYFQNRKVLITNLNLFDSYSLQGSRLTYGRIRNTIKPVYSGHAIQRTLFRGTGRITVKLSQKNPYIVDNFIADNCYSGHNTLAPREKFKPNLPFYSGHYIFCGKIKGNCYSIFSSLYLTTFCPFTFGELSTFSNTFLSQFVTLESL